MENLNLFNYFQQFPTEEACLEYLEKIRWPEQCYCPHCGSIKTYKFKSGKLFKCGDCRKQFTAKVGTIFTDSHIPLQKWFLAVYMLTSLKKGVSSVAIHKQLNVTQKTAWFMLQRIRYAMSYGTLDKPLDGTIEGDETYIGGKATRPDTFSSKMAVMGLVEKRKGTGKIVTKVTKRADATVALPFIRAYAKQGAPVQTDESAIYHRLKLERPHQFVTHAKGEYVREAVTTNTIEGAWSHLKLGIKAVYMSRVSPRHLGMYCDEFGFRYNTRDLNEGERFEQWMLRAQDKHLPYKILVG